MDMLVLRKMDKVAYRARRGARARRPSELRHRGAGDRLEPEARELWPAVDAPSRRRGRPRHARPRGEHPDAGIRPAHLPHRHPHRARARAGRSASPSRCASANRAAAACIPARPMRCCIGASTSAACATEAQEFGFMTDPAILRPLSSTLPPAQKIADAAARATCSASGRACCASSARSATARAASRSARSATTITRTSPTCRSTIPEKTPEKVALGRSLQAGAQDGRGVAGLSEWNSRWVGPEGYKGIVARQLQEFKARAQKQSREDADGRSSRSRSPRRRSRRRRASSAPISSASPTARRWSASADPTIRAALRHHRARRRPRDRARQAPHDGVARIRRWNDRHKYYNDELALTLLEETSLELVYWLEDAGYPAIIVPPTHVDPWRYQTASPNEHLAPLLSLPHAAVEAGSARSASTCSC